MKKKPSGFDMPTPRVPMTVTMDDVYAEGEKLRVERLKLDLADAEALLEFWRINGPPEDETLVPYYEQLRREAASELAFIDQPGSGPAT